MTLPSLPRSTPEPSSLVLVLPEPPSLNEMLDLAKKRARTKNGSIPIVYDRAKAAYAVQCDAKSRRAGIFPPREPWDRWLLVSVVFRLHNQRDPVELLAGLKWPVDWLVDRGFVADDSPRHLGGIPFPAQSIARSDRGVTLTIARVPDDPTWTL